MTTWGRLLAFANVVRLRERKCREKIRLLELDLKCARRRVISLESDLDVASTRIQYLQGEFRREIAEIGRQIARQDEHGRWQ